MFIRWRDRFMRWWYGRQGVIWCAGAIIDCHLRDEEGNSVDPCVWCGMTEEESNKIASRTKEVQQC